MKALLVLVVLLLTGCATQFYAGVGYDLSDSTFDQENVWHNPVGVVGGSFPIGNAVVLDYRHISNMGGSDVIESSVVSVLVVFGGDK